MTVQIWLHRLQDKQHSSRRQSRVARQLLDLACQTNGIELDQEHLDRPGLELIDLLQQQHKLAVSISHCRQLVVVGLSCNRLGVDCESPGRRNNCQGIADNYFQPREADNIRHSDARKTEEAFLRHWVLKESMIKANRGSVLTDLNQLIIGDDFTSVALDAAATQTGPWQVWEGRFADCFLGLSSATTTLPPLTFFESPEPASGTYVSCGNRVTGRSIPVTRALRDA